MAVALVAVRPRGDAARCRPADPGCRASTAGRRRGRWPRSPSSGCCARSPASRSGRSAGSPRPAPPASPSTRCSQVACRPRATAGRSPARSRTDPLRDDPGRPAADRAARQGRAARLRRELRPGRGAGLVLLAGRRAPCSTTATGGCAPPASPSRSAFLTSPTFGAASWLAHSTLQSGLWVDSERRYDQLLDERPADADATRSSAPAGARSPTCRPTPRTGRRARRSTASTSSTTPATSATQGPEFGYATMPDQYTLAAFRRQELRPADRPPVMAEIDLVSSHHPWTPLPHLVPWDQVGDGSVFDGMPEQGEPSDEVFARPRRGPAAYGESIEYSLETLVSFLEQQPDPDLVLVVLGDHQPAHLRQRRRRRPRRARSASSPGTRGDAPDLRMGLAGRPAARRRTRRSGGWTRSATGSSRRTARDGG